MNPHTEARAVTADDLTAQERKRRNHPVLDVARTVDRTYRDLLVFGSRGATLTVLHAEGFNRFTASARRVALDRLISLGHVELLEVARVFATTPTSRGITRHVTIYRLTAPGTIHIEARLNDQARARIAVRRHRHAVNSENRGVVRTVTNLPTPCNARTRQRSSACDDHPWCTWFAGVEIDPVFRETIAPLEFDEKAVARAFRIYRILAASRDELHDPASLRTISHLTAVQRDAMFGLLESLGVARRSARGSWSLVHCLPMPERGAV